MSKNRSNTQQPAMKMPTPVQASASPDAAVIDQTPSAPVEGVSNESAPVSLATPTATVQDTPDVNAGVSDEKIAESDTAAEQGAEDIKAGPPEDDVYVAPPADEVQQESTGISESQPVPAEAIPEPEVQTPVASGAHHKNLPGSQYAAFDSLNMGSRMALGTILNYLDNMRPDLAVSPATGAQQQKALYSALVALFKNQVNVKAALSVIHALFREHGGIGKVLSDVYVMRFHDMVVMTADERRAFANIVDVLRMSADPRARQTVLKQIDLPLVIQRCVTSAGLDAASASRLLQALSE